MKQQGKSQKEEGNQKLVNYMSNQTLLLQKLGFNTEEIDKEGFDIEKAVSEFNDKLAQRFQLLRIWIVMNTIRKRLCLCTILNLAYTLGNSTVGKKHELLNKFVGIF